MRHHFIHLAAVVGWFAAGCAALGAFDARAEGGYSMTVLEVPKRCGFFLGSATAVRVDADGGAIGSLCVPGPHKYDASFQAARWTPEGAVSELITNPDQHGWRVFPRAVNRDGIVVGSVVSEHAHAVVVKDGTAYPIGTDLDEPSAANAINDAGEVVGFVGRDAFLWSEAKGFVRFASPSPKRQTDARGINNRGLIVGETDRPEGPLRGFARRGFYRNADGHQKIASGTVSLDAVNDDGFALGEYVAPDYSYRTAVFDPAHGRIELPKLANVDDCKQVAINGRSQVVGSCYGGAAAASACGYGAAVLWTPTADGYRVEDLNARLAASPSPPGMPICGVVDINDAGVMLVEGNVSDRVFQALLKP